MLPRSYPGQNCSVARTLEVVGERWTMLLLREAFNGVRRFEDFQQRLDIARNVLAARLEWLCEQDILRRHRYHERPERFEYRLTDKGLDLWPVLIALLNWGDRYHAPNGPPRVLEHRDCGGAVTDRRTCAVCGVQLGPRDVRVRPGPGAESAPVPAGSTGSTG